MDLPAGSLLATVRFGPEEDKTLAGPLSMKPGAFHGRNSFGPEEELLAGLAVIPVFKSGGKQHLAVQLLHPAELTKAAAFTSEVRRRSYESGRVAAKLAIRQVFPGLAGPEVNITASPLGKPTGEGLLKHYSVSISHSDNHGAALCFPAAFPMGVDIETPEEKNHSIISSILSPGEIALLQTQCKGPETFKQVHSTVTDHETALIPAQDNSLQILHVMWTAKEAAGKATGLGFRLPVEQYEIEMIKKPEDHKIRSWICNFKHLGEITTISLEWQGAILTIAFTSGSGFGDAFLHLFDNGS
jgi:phosphopantetheinyl transferase